MRTHAGKKLDGAGDFATTCLPSLKPVPPSVLSHMKISLPLGLLFAFLIVSSVSCYVTESEMTVHFTCICTICYLHYVQASSEFKGTKLHKHVYCKKNL
jgi:hypothetical protein